MTLKRPTKTKAQPTGNPNGTVQLFSFLSVQPINHQTGNLKTHLHFAMASQMTKLANSVAFQVKKIILKALNISCLQKHTQIPFFYHFGHWSEVKTGLPNYTELC